MLQEAIITKTMDNGLAEVVVERSGICGGNCDDCDECRYNNLIKSTVENTINARRGQHVMIETPTMGVVKGALAIYILPIVMLVAGYFVAAAFSLSEGACILVAFCAAIVGFLLARVISKRSFNGNPTPTKIISIIDVQE